MATRTRRVATTCAIALWLGAPLSAMADGESFNPAISLVLQGQYLRSKDVAEQPVHHRIGDHGDRAPFGELQQRGIARQQPGAHLHRIAAITQLDGHLLHGICFARARRTPVATTSRL